MKVSSTSLILICSAALSCGLVAQDQTPIPRSEVTAKSLAEGLKSTMILEFKCNDEPLDSVLERLSKLSGMELKLQKDTFNGKPLPAVTLPALRGLRLEDLLNTITAVSATKWLVAGSCVEVSKL